MQGWSGDVAKIRVNTLSGLRAFGPMAWGRAQLIEHNIGFDPGRRSPHANLELPRIGELVGPREAHR